MENFQQCNFKSDGKLYYNSSYLQKLPSFDPTQPTVIAAKKTYVYLFHELVHFLHRASFGWSGYHADAVEEFRTVGLYNFKSEALCENALRREAGLPRRPCYSWVKTDTDMYSAERAMRNGLKLPQQNTVGPSSPECKF